MNASNLPFPFIHLYIQNSTLAMSIYSQPIHKCSNLPIELIIHLSICPPFAHPSRHPSVHLYLYLPLLYPLTDSPTHLFIQPCIHLPMHLFSAIPLLYPSVRLTTYPSSRLFIHLQSQFDAYPPTHISADISALLPLRGLSGSR